MAIYPFAAPISTHGNHGAFEGASSTWQALNTDDNQTFGCNNNGGGVARSYMSLAEPMVAAAYTLTFRSKSLGTPHASFTFKWGLSDASGNIYWGAATAMSEADGAEAEHTYAVPHSSPEAGGEANKLYFETNTGGGEDGTYLLFDLLTGIPDTFVLTISSDANCAWDQEGAVLGNPGATPSFTLTPAAGYVVADVLVDSVSVGDASGDASYLYTFAALAANHTLAGSAAVSRTVTTSNITQGGAGGTITPTANYADGADVTITATPSAGFGVRQFIVDGVDLGAVTSVTFTDVAAAHTVQVLFAGRPAVVTAYSSGSLTAGMGEESLAKRRGIQQRRY